MISMSEMTVAIHRRTAYIHADTSFVDRLEKFLATGERVVYKQIVLNHILSGFERIGHFLTAVDGTLLLDHTESILIAFDVLAESEQ